ncbi:hypothetical protein [Aeromicrobium ginsengisoli]|uniref:Uncharacterized protein n=1 Tax=Aeromicrobium ginsengisoli TaxID=363867 RepID=A0A5M4FAQ4_9ACTN|nr:hypothetical protein [Aeromicrobium ginsengisoli]KAA1395438.1 hypothetical protein ESP70_014875 [Aeromicrobium ginsengisoli]
MRTLAVALLLVLAGCGGGSDDPPATKATTSAPTQAVTTPTVAPPKGTPAPEALSKFRCAKTPKGVWNSSGFIANAGKSKVTYQVTVYVGEAAGGAEKAKTRQLANVSAGGSTRFVINNLPAPENGGSCHVQVLAQR